MQHSRRLELKLIHCFWQERYGNSYCTNIMCPSFKQIITTLASNGIWSSEHHELKMCDKSPSHWCPCCSSYHTRTWYIEHKFRSATLIIIFFTFQPLVGLGWCASHRKSFHTPRNHQPGQSYDTDGLREVPSSLQQTLCPPIGTIDLNYQTKDP